MESFTPKPLDDAEKPEKTGRKEAPKKSRKKTTRVPLKAAQERAVPTKESTPKRVPLFPELLAPEKTAAPKKKLETEEPKQPKEPLELPEVKSPEEDFAGELHIDHQSEAIPEQLSRRAGESKEPVEPEISPEVPEEGSVEPETPVSAQQEATDQTREAFVETDKSVEEQQDPTDNPPPRVAPPLLFDLPGEVLRAAPDRPLVPTPELAVDPNTLFQPDREPIFPRITTEVPSIPLSEANDRAYRAEKRGLSRGVVSGGLVGWWLGRRNKQAAVRETRLAAESRERQLKDAAENTETKLQTAERRVNILERTQQEMHKLMQRTWDRDVLKRKETAAPAEIPSPRNIPEIVPVPESARPVFETAPRSKVEKPVQPEKTRQSQETAKEITDEPIKPADGNRVEVSAWHRIEVDEKTGKAVENPAVAYGEAFVKEKKQEKLALDAAKAQAAPQLGMTVLLSGTDVTNTPISVATEKQDEAKKQGTLLKDFRANSAYVREQLIHRTTSPATWAIALGLVVFLFVTGVIR